MKNKQQHIFLTFFFLLMSILSYAQSPWIGTWEADMGNNQIFRVQLWERPDNRADLVGHFKMVEIDNNGNENILYRSDKNIGNGYTWPTIILIDNTDNLRNGGNIGDNTITSEHYHTLNGKLSMQMHINPESITCSWQVKRMPGIVKEIVDFNIPTNLTLTKVQE